MNNKKFRSLSVFILALGLALSVNGISRASEPNGIEETEFKENQRLGLFGNIVLFAKPNIEIVVQNYILPESVRSLGVKSITGASKPDKVKEIVKEIKLKNKSYNKYSDYFSRVGKGTASGAKFGAVSGGLIGSFYGGLCVYKADVQLAMGTATRLYSTTTGNNFDLATTIDIVNGFRTVSESFFLSIGIGSIIGAVAGGIIGAVGECTFSIVRHLNILF
ncbi:hypothetical protein FACS1894152_4150 [Bacilli bacterium]|nr:hypothetical protein FACS1894152_4150 [Bacilli bacterium]